MKNELKLFSMILFALMSFVVFQATAYAAGEHKFSFKAWQCGTFDEDEEMCAGPNNDYPMPEDLPSIALGNGSNIQPGVVNAGDLIQLAVYYEPGDETFWNMSAFIIYDPELVQPLHYDGGAGGLVLVQTSSPYNEDYPGPYPPAGESGKKLKQTNWVVSFNDSLTSYNITSVIKDTAGSAAERKYLEDSGSLYYVYFKIKDDVEPGTVITFSYNMAQGKTKIANNAPVISESGTVQVYKELDTDTTLSNLTVSDGTTNYLTNFNSNTKTYNVYVPNSVSNVTVVGTPTKGTTTATNDPEGSSYSLNVSTTKTVNILTLAESGDTDTYTVNIYRLDNNANLTALSLGSGVTLSPTFASGTTSYTASVPYSTSSVSVSATKASTKASVSGTGNKNLTAGATTDVQVVVTPECAGSAYSSVPGNTGTACQAKTYSVAVTRAAASTNNYLSSLTVDGTSVPSFNKTNNGPYNLEVNGNVSSVTIGATVEDTGKATIGSGNTGSKTLNDGNNSFNVVVTPESSTPTRTYTVNVYRKSNVTNLSGLTVTSSPQGTLNPTSFNPSTKTYTYTVGPDVTSVTITPTSNKNATITADGTSNGTGGYTYNPQTQTTATIHVVSEDETANTDYVVNLVRTKSTDTTLSELSVAGYTLSPAYSDSTNSYSVTVPSTATSVNVTATPNDSRTTATVSGGTNLTTGNNTVTVTVTPENGASSARTITITVKKLAADADLTALTLTDVNYGTFNKNTLSYTATVPYTTTKTKVSATLSDTKASKVVKLNGTTITENSDVNLAIGLNTFTVEVKAEDTNVTKTYTVAVTREAASTNNYLSDLKVDGNTVEGFVKTTNDYNIGNVSATTNSITIAATKEDSNATISGDTGVKTLSEGENTFTITVTPQDPTAATRDYTITVYKLNNNSNLGSLTVTSDPAGTLTPSFNAGTKTYTYTVGPDVTEITVSATKGNEKQKTITGTGTFNPLNVTSTNIVVTAEDDSTSTYTVNFVRSESTNANLSSLEVVGYTIAPAFDPNVTSYTLTVPSDVESVTVTADLADDKADIDGANEVYVLDNGENTITVTVTAEDGVNIKEYSITVTKQSSDADLTALTLTNVNYGTFNKNTLSYTATVPYATDKTKVSATLSDTKASKVVKLNGTTITENTDVNLAVGLNTFTVEVKAEDTNVTKTYTVAVTRETASTNSYLSNITIDGEPIDEFDKTNTEYDLGNVSPDKDSITIGAEAEDDKSEVTGDTGEQPLVDGENTFTITVTPEDPNEEPREYTITVYKQNGDTTLGSLTVTSNPQGTLDPESYSSTVKEYTYTVGPDVTEVTVSATKGNDKQKSITGTGTFNPQTTAKTDIVVTAEDDSTDTYTVNFVRTKSTNANLSALGTVEFDSLNEDFDPNETNYTLTVPSDTEIVTVTATLADDRATKSGDDVYVFGENDTQVTATVTVIAEDNETTKTYTIVITKQGANADLTNLTLENVDFGTFVSGTISYTATVPYATDKTKVNATLSDTNATKTVKLNGETITEDTDVDLVVGTNTITVDVVAEDTNVTKTYTVTVTRSEASSNALLSAIYVGDEEIEVESGQFEYSITVPNTTTSVEVTVDTVDPTANVTSGTGTKELDTGDNTVTITVEAEDGTPATYTVTIRRTDTIDTLSDIGITSDPEGSMDKPFTPNETEYTYTISPDTESVTVKPIASSDAATVTVNGEPVGEDGYTFDPNDVDEVVIVVTPEEGEPKTYTVTIEKELNINNYLQSLTVADYDINPIFDKTTPDYTLTVDVAVESIIVTAIPEVETSTVVIDGANADGEVSLTSEVTIIKITVTPQDPGAESRDYTLTVTKVDDSEYITSEEYGHVIEEGIIKTVKPETLPETLRDQLDNENEKLHIFKITKSGEETTETELGEDVYVGTGMIIKLITDGVLKDFKSILVKGDVTGDGAIELQDVMIVLSNYLGNSQLEGIYFMAANMNDEGEIDLQDVMSVLKMYLGL